MNFSYSYMQNIKAIINNHNIIIFRQSNEMKHGWRQKVSSFRWKMFIGKQKKVTLFQSNYTEKVYFGVAEKLFKDGAYNHVKLFIHKYYRSNTELLEEYWEIKKNNYIPSLTWSIIREYPLHNVSKRKCCFYLNEKVEINSYKGKNLLNKTSERISKCRHLIKHALLLHDNKDQ